MKIIEKLRNKRVLMVLAGLVGLGGMLAAPISMAGTWRYHYHYWHRNHYGPTNVIRVGFRHVVVRRQCWVTRFGYRHCNVQRYVYFN